MTPRARKAKTETTDGQFVKVGDVIELESGGNGLAVLPDDTVVTVRQRYIDGVEYLAEK